MIAKEEYGKILRRLGSILGFSAVVAIFLAIWAPFGTDYIPFFRRFLLWQVFCFSGALGTATVDGLLFLLKKRPSLILRILLHSFGATVFVSIVLMWVFPRSSLSGVFVTILLAWTVSIFIAGLGELLRSQRSSTSIVEEALLAPRLVDRLPVEFRQAEIHALGSEDHYVRVYTAIGSTLLLIRLSDAIAEMVPIEGLQTHRSWWVAKAGVKSVKKKNRSAEIILKCDDIIVPVSRNHMAALKDGNWL